MRAAHLVFLSCGFFVADACTNYIVSPEASADGSAQVAYNSDGAVLYGYMRHFAGGRHPPGARREIYGFESGEHTGSIPEAVETFNVIGNMNEHGLAIGETSFGGLDSLGSQPGAILDYGSMIWITLQRARTAHEAIRLFDQLTAEHGYNSQGESFSIADTREAWVMDMIGKGPGERGTVWVARRVPPGHVSAHANQARIQTWPRTNESLWHPDTVAFAKRKGLYPEDGADEDFSFSDVFDPVTPLSARTCELRVWNFFRQVADPAENFGERWLDYVKGQNLTQRMPLFVRAHRAIPVNDTMWYMRTNYEGTYFDGSRDFGAGPFHSQERPRNAVWTFNGQEYFFERTVGYIGTFWHFVAQCRGSLPHPLTGLIWFGVDDSSLSVRVPMYAATRSAPSKWAYGHGDTDTFKQDAAYWAFNLVSNLAYTRYDIIVPEVQAAMVATERSFFQAVAEVDAEVLARLQDAPSAEEGEREALEVVESFSLNTASVTVDAWVQFWQRLFVRYRDGLNTISGRSQTPEGDEPRVRSSYDSDSWGSDWQARFVAETGDHFAVPAATPASAMYQSHKLQMLAARAGASSDPSDSGATVDEAISVVSLETLKAFSRPSSPDSFQLGALTPTATAPVPFEVLAAFLLGSVVSPLAFRFLRPSVAAAASSEPLLA